MGRKFVVAKTNLSEDLRDCETKGQKNLSFCSVGTSAFLINLWSRPNFWFMLPPSHPPHLAFFVFYILWNMGRVRLWIPTLDKSLRSQKQKKCLKNCINIRYAQFLIHISNYLYLISTTHAVVRCSKRRKSNKQTKSVYRFLVT